MSGDRFWMWEDVTHKTPFYGNMEIVGKSEEAMGFLMFHHFLTLKNVRLCVQRLLAFWS